MTSPTILKPFRFSLLPTTNVIEHLMLGIGI